MVGKPVEGSKTTVKTPVDSTTSAQPVPIVVLTEENDNRSTATTKRSLDDNDETPEQNQNTFCKQSKFTDGRKSVIYKGSKSVLVSPIV